jgi:hypothetical protein
MPRKFSVPTPDFPYRPHPTQKNKEKEEPIKCLSKYWCSNTNTEPKGHNNPLFLCKKQSKN